MLQVTAFSYCLLSSQPKPRLSRSQLSRFSPAEVESDPQLLNPGAQDRLFSPVQPQVQQMQAALGRIGHSQQRYGPSWVVTRTGRGQGQVSRVTRGGGVSWERYVLHLQGKAWQVLGFLIKKIYQLQLHFEDRLS